MDSFKSLNVNLVTHQILEELSVTTDNGRNQIANVI